MNKCGYCGSWFVAVSMVLLLAMLVPLVAQTSEYSVVDLGTLGGRRSIARDINAAGQVVGYSEAADGSMRAFLYTAGSMLPLGTFGGAASVAHGITDNGLIVGRAQTVAGQYSPFVSLNGQQLLEPSWFDRALHGVFGDALAANTAGQALGYYSTPGSHMASQNRVFLFRDFALTDLGTFGGHDGVVTGVNAHGHVVGYFGTDEHADYSDQRSFLATQSASAILPTLGGRTTVALDLNDADQVVGHGQTRGGERHAFLFANRTLTDLGTLPGGVQSFAYGINNAGQIVGASESDQGSLSAVLYQGGAVTDLNRVIPSGSGWVLTEARSINAAGQIVGNGIFDGRERAFLLSPVLATAR